MNGRRVIYLVLFFAVAIIVMAEHNDNAQRPGDVSIWGTTVTLTCPFDDDVDTVKWYRDETELSEGSKYIIKDYNDKNDGLIYCSPNKERKQRHNFLIKAKVCSQCVDMDISLALSVVFADMLFTLVVVLVVYFCTRKRAGTATPQRPTQARQPRPQARGPPPPDPDYQPLNPATRGNDVYAMAHRR